MWCEKVEEHVMLWADTHKLSSLIHLTKHVNAKEISHALGFLDETGEYRNRCCLASAVMSQQTEDLVCVHLDVDALHSMQSVLVDFLQAGDLQKLLIPFLILDLRIKLFVAFWVH